MTRAEAFDKAWRLAFKGDFSLYDEIYHPEFKGVLAEYVSSTCHCSTPALLYLKRVLLMVWLSLEEWP